MLLTEIYESFDSFLSFYGPLQPNEPNTLGKNILSSGLDRDPKVHSAGCIDIQTKQPIGARGIREVGLAKRIFWFIEGAQRISVPARGNFFYDKTGCYSQG